MENQPINTIQADTQNQPTLTQQPMQPTSLKSKTPLILAIIIPSMLIIAAALGYFFFYNPQKTASDAFMKAITAGDVEKAAELTDTPEGQRSFLENAATSTQGNFKLEDSKKQNSKSYFLYSLDNDKNKYARTVVEKESGKYTVSSFVFSPNKLKLIASESATVNEPDTNSDTAVDSKPSASRCLAAADTKNSLGFTVNVTKDTAISSGSVYFKTNSLEYDLPTMAEKRLSEFTQLYKDNSSKDFVLKLSGSVSIQQYTEAGVAFAKQRSEKVRSELIARGVPANYVTLGETVKGTPTGEDYQRSVNITILSTCY